MGSWEGNGIDRLLRAARKEANMLDARNGANILRAARLHMPVNLIGSTALEYMKGDLTTVYVPGAKLIVWSLKKNPKGTTWTKAGRAFVNRDGSLNIYLDVLPIDGTLHVREDKGEVQNPEPVRQRHDPDVAAQGPMTDEEIPF